MSKGFSLVEVLVVTVIIAVLSAALFFNFGTAARNKTARLQTASVIASDIRRAQSMALSGTRFGGNTVCGYGIRYLTPSSYFIYAGFKGVLSKCQDANRNYEAGTDQIVETKKLINSKMEFRSSFSDVFFESPDPKTFLNNSSVLTDSPVTITVQRVGQTSCGGQTCAKIEIYTSGQINLTD